MFDLSSQSDCRLYSGSSLSTFQALSILFSWFSLHPGISKAAFDHLLKILNKHFLPSDNELPTSYKDARKMFNTYLSPVVKYDCCINDCVIFHDSSSGKFSKLDKCPVCNESRFKSESKNVPRRHSNTFHWKLGYAVFLLIKQHHLSFNYTEIQQKTPKQYQAYTNHQLGVSGMIVVDLTIATPER